MDTSSDSAVPPLTPATGPDPGMLSRMLASPFAGNPLAFAANPLGFAAAPFFSFAPATFPPLLTPLPPMTDLAGAPILQQQASVPPSSAVAQLDSPSAVHVHQSASLQSAAPSSVKKEKKASAIPPEVTQMAKKEGYTKTPKVEDVDGTNFYYYDKKPAASKTKRRAHYAVCCTCKADFHCKIDSQTLKDHVAEQHREARTVRPTKRKSLAAFPVPDDAASQDVNGGKRLKSTGVGADDGLGTVLSLCLIVFHVTCCAAHTASVSSADGSDMIMEAAVTAPSLLAAPAGILLS